MKVHNSLHNIPCEITPDKAGALVDVPGYQVDRGLVGVELVRLLVLQVEVLQHHTCAVYRVDKMNE